ncbi:MAG: O-antigen ligase family protein [Defluviicoccus sp.]|nr:O-antigen ligase family protein [Defluviicoccus sp.]MDG4593568.1 O-antigen ligase family protein [Defluviicoccus sp.]MDS4011448.1 O-antigen ligase family protein [Defluviicoccus sp.]MDS4073743.1 O-antigen ligase family protein [Defluviicoccus sp.]
MEPVFLCFAVASVVLGLFQPALICALSLHSYNYESYFGGNEWIGALLITLTPAIAVIHLVLKQRLRLHAVDILFALFSVCFVIMVLRSSDPAIGAPQVSTFVVAIAGLYLAPRAFFGRTESYKKFMILFVISFVVQALLFSTVAEPTIEGHLERTSIGDGNPVGFGLTLSTALCLTVFWMLSERPWSLRILRILDWLLAAAAFAGLIYAANLNGTRGIFVSVIGATVLFLAYRVWRRVASRSLMLGFGGALAVLVLVGGTIVGIGEIVASLEPETINDRLRHFVLSIANNIWPTEANEVTGELSESREHILGVVWDLIREQPILGVGLNGVKMATVERVNEEAFAHNLILEMWAEGGVVTLAVFLAMVGSILLFGLRQVTEPRTAMPSTVFLGMATGALLHQQVSATLLFGKAAFLALGVLAAAEAVRAHRLSHHERNRTGRRRHKGRHRSRQPQVAVATAAAVAPERPAAGPDDPASSPGVPSR